MVQREKPLLQSISFDGTRKDEEFRRVGEIMIYLYHVAKANTVENILNEGLIPCKTKGITTINPKPVVWLTDNPKFILETQCETR